MYSTGVVAAEATNTTTTTTTTTTSTTTTTTTTITPVTSPVQCMPCKEITKGPHVGTYVLYQNSSYISSPVCKDACIYRKGDDVFCFSSGGKTSVEPCTVTK